MYIIVILLYTQRVIYFIHQMAIHNATKLLPLTSQTKLTLTVTLTLTDTVTLIFMHTLLTPIRRFYRIYKRNVSQRCAAGFVGGTIFCTTQQLHYLFANVAVGPTQLRKRQRQEGDSSYFIIKRGFFVGYI